MSESNPIVVLAFPRTGSSMISQIIEKHGIFLGKGGDPNQFCPTGNSQNLNLEHILIDMFGMGIHLIKEPQKGFRKRMLDAIYAEGYDGGDWMAKHAAVYWKVWEEFEPRYINVRRSLSSIFMSNTVSNMAGRQGKDLMDALDVNIEQMRIVNKKYDAPYIESDEVVAGNYESLENALNHYGIEFDPTIPEQVIDRSHWHF